MNKYICIHGHFYQPPRENPWLEEVERQDSAYPYHDWNERVTAECYAPNTAARILGAQGKISQIISNYSNMSFNFGPTLLSWMARKEPEAYQAILKSDKLSREKFGGHGAALAQCYNHLIMPLANRRDKETQVIWGLRDFEFHFHRPAEGIWLPETAVDIPTLEVLAKYGVKFTILAPHQANAFRKIGASKWQMVATDGFNPRRPYVCVLPSGNVITLFFYDGPISQSVAFDRLLDNGENFAKRLVSAFSEDKENQLVHIATDGETYGHHHKLGDMGLAYCINYLKIHQPANLTIYSEYLEKNPPEYEVMIHENSSWSCSHGIERWRSDCGCNVGHKAGWNQKWRAPLRLALDWLRDKSIALYETEMPKYATEDIWKVRDTFILPILDRSPENIKHLLERVAKPEVKDHPTRFLQLLEMQRHALLMYTSCGWFFDDLSGIETVQIMCYAARVVQLIKDISGQNVEDEFLQLLEAAPTNVPELENGRKIYEAQVKNAVLDLPRVGAHYAISALFEDYKDREELFCYNVKSQKRDFLEFGKQQLVIGKVLIESSITFEKSLINYAVLHLGDHNFIAGIRASGENDNYQQMHTEVRNAFKKGDAPQTIKLIEKYFENYQYTLWHLFKDEQTKILYRVLEASLEAIQNSLRQINEHHYPVVQVISQMGIPLPKVLANTFLVTINTDLLHAIGSNPPDFQRLTELVQDIKKWSLEIDWVTVEFLVRKRLDHLMMELQASAHHEELLTTINHLLSILLPLTSLKIDLWKIQNIYFSIAQAHLPPLQSKANQGDKSAHRWVEQFKQLGNYLNVSTA